MPKTDKHFKQKLVKLHATGHNSIPGAHLNMQDIPTKLRIAIVGGGPTGLLMLKRLTETDETNFTLDIFERKQLLGAGMPYSRDGALDEHITNVSSNEIPDLAASVDQWIHREDQDTLNRFNINPEQFNEYKVLPRLLFGRYLSDQFQHLLRLAKDKGLLVKVHYGTEVTDIQDEPGDQQTRVITNQGNQPFDRVIICSGHFWPKKLEGNYPRCYDSPYPPSKIAQRCNHTVALRGSSLTAIDAIRTLARCNGSFSKDESGRLSYTLDAESPEFKLVMHSRNGLLPAVRFHLEDSHLAKDSVLSDVEIATVRAANQGFLPLDYVYQRNFLEGLEKQHPMFHALIKHLPLEDFVQMMMDKRENTPAFELLQQEMDQASWSIKERESVHWKEMLAILSFAMNYPAKYFSAEDMERLKKSLMPLISVIIAFAPQSSVAEMLTLHQAGLLDIISVGDQGEVEPQDDGGCIYRYTDEAGTEHRVRYQTYVDCIGQPHLSYSDLPYPSLLQQRTVSHATLKFKDQGLAKIRKDASEPNVHLGQDGQYYLTVPGVAINDHFQLVDEYGALNERIYMLAVPFIGGYNPDFSGLDFGEAASGRVLQRLFDVRENRTSA